MNQLLTHRKPNNSVTPTQKCAPKLNAIDQANHGAFLVRVRETIGLYILRKPFYRRISECP